MKTPFKLIVLLVVIFFTTSLISWNSLDNHDKIDFKSGHNSNNVVFEIENLSDFFMINTLSTKAQKTTVKFLLNENQNRLKQFTVSSKSDSHPVFVDIDGDGDYDCFSGEFNKNGYATVAYFKIPEAM